MKFLPAKRVSRRANLEPGDVYVVTPATIDVDRALPYEVILHQL